VGDKKADNKKLYKKLELLRKLRELQKRNRKTHAQNRLLLEEIMNRSGSI